jgi:MFS family permease
MLGAAGIRSAPGVLIVPLEKDFGWTRATVSFAVSVNLVLFGLLGPFAAALVDRFGPRRIILTALTLLTAGVSATTLMTQPWQLVLLMIAVVMLTAQAFVINRLAGIPYPLWNRVREKKESSPG